MAKPFVDGSGDDVREAYEDVRNDSSETTWAAFTYEGKLIKHAGSGTEYAEFLELLGDDERVYGYVRFETGDEMSRRAKFALITWIGPGVGALKKAKVSTDKAFIKEIMPNFGKEILADERKELEEKKVIAELEKASGAAYGVGK